MSKQGKSPSCLFTKKYKRRKNPKESILVDLFSSIFKIKKESGVSFEAERKGVGLQGTIKPRLREIE